MSVCKRTERPPTENIIIIYYLYDRYITHYFNNITCACTDERYDIKMLCKGERRIL